MTPISDGRRKYCRTCHALNMRTKYKNSRDDALARFRKTDGYREWRRRSAIKQCGVPSSTSARSKRSEEYATQARSRWHYVDDDVLINGGHKESELVHILGRTIRAIQRRKAKLRKDMEI